MIISNFISFVFWYLNPIALNCSATKWLCVNMLFLEVLYYSIIMANVLRNKQFPFIYRKYLVGYRSIDIMITVNIVYYTNFHIDSISLRCLSMTITPVTVHAFYLSLIQLNKCFSKWLNFNQYCGFTLDVGHCIRHLPDIYGNVNDDGASLFTFYYFWLISEYIINYCQRKTFTNSYALDYFLFLLGFFGFLSQKD